MKVILRNPKRELDLDGPRRVHALLASLQLNRESHLVIRNGTLVPSTRSSNPTMSSRSAR